MSASTSEAAHRNVINFCKELGMTPTETHKKLKLTEAHRNVSRALVFKWHKRYTDGYMNEETKQEKRGRPKEIDDNVMEKKMTLFVMTDVGQCGRWKKCWGSVNHPFIAFYLII